MSEELIKARTAELAKFYQAHNPEKVGDAETLVRGYPFLSIVASLEAKYGKAVMDTELPSWMAELQKQKDIEEAKIKAAQNPGNVSSQHSTMVPYIASYCGINMIIYDHI